MKGYVVGHPWTAESPPRLNTKMSPIVESSCFFIHDIVVLEECRGRGIGDQIIQKIVSENETVSLVAMDGTIKTKAFWQRYGFVEVDGSSCGYGVFMVRKKRFQ